VSVPRVTGAVRGVLGASRPLSNTG
jgi:hypothetical protein